MFKALRRYLWVSQSFLSRHSRLIWRTAGIILGIILLFFLFARYLPTPKQSYRIARVGKYNLVDLPIDIQNEVSLGLVTVDDEGVVHPALASQFSLSDDGLTYTFTLDPKLSWHNGTRVVPADITYNFNDVEVSSDSDTVTYKLKEPFAPFYSAVSKPLLKKNKFGVGEYRITKSVLGNGVLQKLIIESDTVRKIYKFYPTESSALTAFKLGEVDIVDGLTLYPESFNSDPTTSINKSEISRRHTVLFFNNNDSILTSKPTRQALAYAIKDKTHGSTRQPSPISINSWAYNPLVKTYDFDLPRAQNLFNQENPNKNSVKLEIKTMLSYLDLAESIASDWREAFGVEVSVKVVSNIADDYQILLADFAPPTDPDQYTIWHSTQPTNFTHYSNLKVDQLLEDGRRTSNLKLRRELYQDFQRFLLEDSPAVFLFASNSYTLERKPIF